MLLLVCSTFLVSVSEARAVRDYIFGVTGVVTNEDGTPLQGAEVTLKVNSPVYKAVEPVKTVQRLTESDGGFVFMYLTGHKRGVKYTITVRKEGFEAQTVSGSAPPPGHHAIRLKRARGNGTTP